MASRSHRRRGVRAELGEEAVPHGQAADRVEIAAVAERHEQIGRRENRPVATPEEQSDGGGRRGEASDQVHAGTHQRSCLPAAAGREYPVQRRLHPRRGHVGLRGPTRLHGVAERDPGAAAQDDLSGPRTGSGGSYTAYTVLHQAQAAEGGGYSANAAGAGKRQVDDGDGYRQADIQGNP